MGWMEGAQTWLVTNGASFAVNLLAFLLILLAAKVAIGATARVARRAMERSERVSELLQDFLTDILRKALWVVGLMVALSQLGVDMAPLIAGLGIFGFVIGFAFQDSLGNLAAGLMILLNQPFTVGHYVEAGGMSGTVQELNLMATTLMTPDHRKVIVPNAQIWGSAITNYSAMDTRRVDMSVGIGYGSDIGKAIEIVHDMLSADARVLDDPAPVVEVGELADSSVNLIVRPWVNAADYWPLKFAFTRAVKERFDAAGIEIPFPQLDVHTQGGA